MALDAVIFDVDGTLVDTNKLHAQAFEQAFSQCGYKVAPDLILPEIGKGGDHLIPDLIGKSANEKDGERIKKIYGEEFLKSIEEKPIEVFHRVLDLLTELRRRGFKTAIATSADKKYFEAICKSANVDLASHVDLVTTADDAKQSKPAPDILLATCDKLNLSVAQCAIVGDTPHDAESAKRAGVVCLGVLSGGNSEEVLLGSGARRVYKEVAEIMDNLDEALEIASPGNAKITRQLQETLMQQALEAAREGVQNGEAPIGCVLARGDGTIIARGWNKMQSTQNKTAHAEIETFAQAAGKVPPDARDLILVSTLEPCVMCTGAAMESAIDTILFALPAPADQGSTRVRPPQSPESQMPRIVGRVLESQSRALFAEWLKDHEEHEGAAYVKQLLETTEKM